MTLRWIAPMMLLASIALAAVPAADASCTYFALFTIGDPTFPHEGVYEESGCYPFASASGWTASGGVQSGSNPIVCQPVTSVFVLGQQVPLTGATYCTPPTPSPSASIPLAPVPDAGVASCFTVDGKETCAWITPWYLYWNCQNRVGTLTVPLPGGGVVYFSCALTP